MNVFYDLFVNSNDLNLKLRLHFVEVIKDNEEKNIRINICYHDSTIVHQDECDRITINYLTIYCNLAFLYRIRYGCL